jgi:hypothetical protein
MTVEISMHVRQQFNKPFVAVSLLIGGMRGFAITNRCGLRYQRCSDILTQRASETAACAE